MAMAQGTSSSLPANEPTLTAAELREILEYEKIVQFRDAVLAGTHPRIKIAPHLVGKQVNNSSRSLSSPNNSNTTWRASALKTTNRAVSTHHGTSSASQNNNISPNNQRAGVNGHPTMFGSSKSEINPILLEKSDDLIKAEIQLQRQRVERALREQIEQQRLAAKLQTSEGVPNFDVAEVLAKALAIVHPSTTGAEPSMVARSPPSDSFDENTFYSSQHDTPVSSRSSPGQQEPLEVQAGVADEPPAQNYSTHSRIGGQDALMAGISTNNQLSGQSNSYVPSSSSQKRSQIATVHYEQARETEYSDSSNSLRETGEPLKVSVQEGRPNIVSLHQNNHISQ
jgi:hypothetical protein